MLKSKDQVMALRKKLARQVSGLDALLENWESLLSEQAPPPTGAKTEGYGIGGESQECCQKEAA